ncbi:Endopeptidase, NLPC/P60 domain containing protein [Candidatus Nanopelagicaceae bacterium]|jgi:peptidoglycan DL-endopeptidase CwlO|uniref:Cell wall hydrolase n=1 Tax=Candidatus Planktophila versatilis TaxID=1884905 RepID=A0ABM6MDF1_9ACTN|nr:cell wall hydrolase [Candidatus Planktophila versatilis]
MKLLRVKKLHSVLLSISILTTISPDAFGANHKPTLAQIEAAKKLELQKKQNAANAAKKLVAAQGSLRKLAALAAAVNKRYLSAKNELAVAVKELNSATKAVQAAEAEVSATHRNIGKLAVAAYMTGGNMGNIETFLSANGPQDVIDTISILENLGSKNKVALEQFKAAEIIAKEARKVAEAAKELQLRATEKVAIAKQEADSVRDAQQKEVDKLQAVQDKLQKELASAKKVRLTLEQKRQLAILEETRSNEATKAPNQAKVWKGGGPNGASSSRTTVEQRLKAVEFAKRQVLAKKPYVWGSEGPNSFDCSGLVYAAYKYAGLGWPNWDRLNSGLYYTYTKQVPIAEMQPGDLIFYSYKGTQSTIHHMSIYAGNGMMWEARSTATGLKYSNIYSVQGMMPFAGRV